MNKIAKKAPMREVDTLPEVAVANEVIFNKSNGCFYIGMENNKKEEEYGNNLEETSLRG